MDYPSPDLEELNSPENKEFVAYLTSEIDGFLKTNGNSNTVMLFPPFNSYKRLLLHHLVESSYNNCGLSTFSIGQEPRRRTVVCLGSMRKNVLDDDANEPKNRSRQRVPDDSKTPVRNAVPTSDKPPERQRKSRKTITYYVPPHLRKSSLEPVVKKEKKDDESDAETTPEGNSSEGVPENAKCTSTPEETVCNTKAPTGPKKVITFEEKVDVSVGFDWDPLYCGKGTCSVPNLVIPILDDSEMNDIAKEVGQVRVVEIVGPTSEESSESSDYVNGSMIEIYDLDDIRTDDLAEIFGDYVGRGFRLRWIDDQHALGIFASSKTAEEALSCQFSRIKIRPISQGTSLSQEIARNVVLPSSFRPKTCSSLAKRLLSGALGLKVSPSSPEERAAQKERLKENKDLRRKLTPL